MPTLTGDLGALRAEFEREDRLGGDIAAALTDAQLAWQPDEGRAWSVAQCLDHIAKGNRAYLDSMRPALASARHTDVPPAIASTAAGRWFIRSLEPPVRRRMRAPGRIVPSASPGRDVVAGYHTAFADLQAVLGSCGTVDVNRTTMPNPFLPLIKVRVGTAFRILAAHARRHLWQAEQVRQQPDFPRS